MRQAILHKWSVPARQTEKQTETEGRTHSDRETEEKGEVGRIDSPDGEGVSLCRACSGFRRASSTYQLLLDFVGEV